MKRKTLKEYFPEAIDGNGIFTEIAKTEWFKGLSPSSFDTYFILKVGDRLASSKLDIFADSDGHVTGQKLSNLAKVILNVNAISWRNIYRDLTVQYNPIENTDYIETVKEKTLGTGEAATQSEGSSTSDSTTNSDVYGFNTTTTPVGDNKTTISASDTTGANTSTTNSNQTDFEREYRKHGNIGTVTNGAMIISDLEVWQNKIADKFIEDICDIIALSIY